MEFSAWMDTLYGWAPTAVKPKSTGSHAMNSGFAAIHGVGMIARELFSGNIIQLESRATGGLLRVNSRTGKVDFHGIHGKQAQFLVTTEGENIITLRCISNTKNFLVLRSGTLYANGKGDPQCRFRYHNVEGHYMKFEAVHNPNRFISVHRKYSGREDLMTPFSTRSSGGSGIQGHFTVVITGHTNQTYAS